MSAQIINGKQIASERSLKVKQDVDNFFKNYGIRPGLAVIQVGNHVPSQIYIKRKQEACEKVGIDSTIHLLPDDISEADLLDLIDRLNTDSSTHGILLQLPLPAHLNREKILNHISWKKDVDGLTSSNLGKLMMGQPHLIPCTPLGCFNLLKTLLSSFVDQNVVVVGRSILVGKSLGVLLLNNDATVTIAHAKTKNLKAVTATADILIAACGVPHLIKGDYIKPGAIVLDVGINRIPIEQGADSNILNPYYRITGDVDFEQAKQVASYITPVPGGVGPMTIVSLLENTLKAAQFLIS